MTRTLSLLLVIVLCGSAVADTNLVTCPQWESKQKVYAANPKKAELLAPTAPKGFLAVYRAMASILGAKQMSIELHTNLEKSGFSDLFDVLMSMHYRGGFPDDFIDAVKRFQKSSAINLDKETYVIDVSTVEMISKLRHSYCK